MVEKTQIKKESKPIAFKKVPRFVRQNRSIKKRVGDAWRYPRGIDNKQRIQKKGTGVMPNIGYRTAKVERGLHPSGVQQAIVHNLNELSLLKKDVAARIAGGVGRKKRLAISQSARKLGIRVLN